MMSKPTAIARAQACITCRKEPTNTAQTRRLRLAGRPLPVAEALLLALEAARGLTNMHALDVAHRTLAPCALLLDDSGSVAIGGFEHALAPGWSAPWHLEPDVEHCARYMCGPACDPWCIQSTIQPVKLSTCRCSGLHGALVPICISVPVLARCAQPQVCNFCASSCSSQ